MAYFRHGLIFSRQIYDRVGKLPQQCLLTLSISREHAGNKFFCRQIRDTASEEPTEVSHEKQDYYGFNDSETELKEFKIYGVDKLLEEVDPVYFEKAGKERTKPKEPLLSRMKFGTIRFDKENKPVDLTNLTVKEDGVGIKAETRRERRKRLRSSKNKQETFSDNSSSVYKLDVCKPDEGKESFIDQQYFEQDTKQNPDINTCRSGKYLIEGKEHEHTKITSDNINNLSYIDDQYFNSDVPGHAKNVVSQTAENVRGRENDNDIGSSYIEAQYFQQEKSEVDSKIVSGHLFPENQSKDKSEQSYIDNQYFGNNMSNVADSTKNPLDIVIKEANDSTVISQSSTNSHQTNKRQNIIEEQRSVQNTRYWHLERTDTVKSNESFQNTRHWHLERTDTAKSNDLTRKNKQKQIKSDSEENSFTGISDSFSSKQNMQTSDEQKIITEGKQRPKKKGLEDLSKEQSAFDVSRKIRTHLEMDNQSNVYGKMNPNKVDSMGFRILSGQVPHLDKVPSIEVVKLLRENILYDDNDIVAINKPYGLPSHGGPGVQNSVGHFLNDIIPNVKLNLIHRLDKETTGVMLLGRTPSVSDMLHDCFRKRLVKKRYLVITKNCPEHPEGIIDIPIAEGSIDGKMRMALRPYNSPELNKIMDKRQGGTEAVTAYRVLDRRNGCAVLECIPETGLKHQIRVHLAFGLNCPVLGDHKYAHVNKIAPMRLNPTVLDLLNIRQSKVRNLAMHLHARSLMIPEFINGRNFFVSAPLPVHFIRNLKDLKLKLPPRV